MTAAQLWRDMQVNQMNDAEAAENWDLPLEAISEIVRYCEASRDLLRAESDEEKLYLEARGVKIDP